MWRLAGNYLMPELLRGSESLALGVSVPTPLMVWWAFGGDLCSRHPLCRVTGVASPR